MLETGMIEQAESQCISSIVLFKKNNGTHRLCVNYGQLNRSVMFSAQPIPEPDNYLHNSVETNIFFSSKFEVVKGF